MFSQYNSDELETFLSRLNEPLTRMPQEDRAEVHQELRQHLDALVAAHMELGASHEEAVRAALQQFGEPQIIGRRLFREWSRAYQPGERQVFPAVVTVLVIHFLCLLALFCGAMGDIATMIVLPPLVAGTVAGWLFPKGGMKGVVIGHLFVPLLLFGLILMGILTGTHGFESNAFDFGPAFLYTSGLWMAVGCGAAFLTIKQRSQVLRRLRAWTSSKSA